MSVGILSVLFLSGLVAASPAAEAATVTYSATQTIPVPPAAGYAGSGGGDGWGLALSGTAVFNVFHHSSQLTVACHKQSDASECWSPVTVSSTTSDFSTPGHTGLWMDPGTHRLYVYATRNADATAGVVCVDTDAISVNGNPFCGFTALTGPDGTTLASGFSALSTPVMIGTRWFAYNHDEGNPNAPQILCFDTATKVGCSGQPFGTDFNSTQDLSSLYPVPPSAAAGTKLFIEITGDAGDELGCFDSASNAPCSGGWPRGMSTSAGGSGSPFPLLDGTGSVTGVCLPDVTTGCFGLDGAATAAPPSMAETVGTTSGWNGPAAIVGARVYIPDGVEDRVSCFDFHAGTGCSGFPRQLADANLVYSVIPDPARPTCLWTNADGGASQIQNFDAYSAGPCGEGPIRVLASQFVVDSATCQPATYTSIRVASPARSTYTSGSVAFRDGNNAAIPGANELPIDASGSVSLAGLNLSTSSGLPQFLITLNGAGAPSEVGVVLTWTGTDDSSCVKPGTTVTGGGSTQPCPDALVVALIGSGQTFASTTDLSVSPQLTKMYNGIASTKGTKTVAIHVIDYPALGVETLTEGLATIRGRNRLDTARKIVQRLSDNIDTYLAGKDDGLAQLHGVLTSVEFGCIGKPTKLLLIGYSQGAMIAHEFLVQLRGSSLAPYILGVGLIADPERVKRSEVTEFSDAPRSSYGACDTVSARVNCAAPYQLQDIPAQFRGRTISVCRSLDPVCSTSELAPLFVVNTAEGRRRLLRLVRDIHSSYSWLSATYTAGRRLGRMLAAS